MRPSVQAVGGVLLVLAVVAGYAWSQRTPTPAHAMDATSVFMDDWRGRGPQRAFDGDVRTEWHAEDMTTGTLIRRFDPPVDIQRITLVNGRNAPWNDRATDRYRIELLGTDEQVVERLRSRASPGERVVHDVRAHGVRELRFITETFHGSSPGVAELTLDLAE
jgi:hypothetical protein